MPSIVRQHRCRYGGPVPDVSDGLTTGRHTLL